MVPWLAMSLFAWHTVLGSTPEPDGVVLRNARAVWKDGRAHLVVDCADKAEYPDRSECGFGAICCALLPDALDAAVRIKQTGPFVATVARNAIRIDGPFAEGTYDLEVRPPLRTRHGTPLVRAFAAQVQVTAPAMVSPPAIGGPPLLVQDDASAPPGAPSGPDTQQSALQLTCPVAGPVDERVAWPLQGTLRHASHADAEVRLDLACFARLVDDARDKAACTSFHYESLWAWTPTGRVHGVMDPHGRIDIACPPVADTALVRGPKVLAAVAEARDAQSGVVLGRAVAQVPVRPAVPSLALRVAPANVPGEFDVDVQMLDKSASPCDALLLTADAVWTEWAWDYGGGRERSVVQPWRTRLDMVTLSGRHADEAWHWHMRAKTRAPHVMVHAYCDGAEATRVISQP